MLESKVTNVWAKPVPPGSPPAPLEGEALFDRYSLVVIESTLPPARPRVAAETGPEPAIRVDIRGAALNMPPDRIAVHDGLVRYLEIAAAGRQAVSLRVVLEKSSDWRVWQGGDLPALTVLAIDRKPFYECLAGKIVAIDPAHGGKDRGARGPINLVEKNVVLDVARRLRDQLALAGAGGVLLRDGDEGLPAEARAASLRECGAHCLLRIHTGHGRDRGERGLRTLYVGSSPRSRALGEAVHRAIIEKLSLKSRGCGRGLGGDWPRQVYLPAAELETVYLADPLEEAFMRDPVFRDRLAQAMVNGLGRFFACGAGQGAGTERG